MLPAQVIAANYAKFAQTHPLYEQKVLGTDLSAYNMAVADFFIQPEVLDIDISNLRGQAGETIHIKAQDNVLVVNVQVVIRQGTAVLEEGEAIQSEADGLL